MASVFILGGTRDALGLAALLHTRGIDVTTSLAGVTSRPQRPIGNIVVGGFGGIAGLANAARDFSLIADATHPFAAQISSNAHAAAARLEIPYVRLERPAWTAGTGDRWIGAASAADAAMALPHGARVLLTIGRKEIWPFVSRADLGGVIRLIEHPEVPVPGAWSLLQARPPFPLAEEVALMARERISVLVAKNSGGELTRAKLDAARALAIPVAMIERPAKPAAETEATPEALADLILRRLR
jgi:precorrin-6A/cobalt-precorrin-6A reductase